jgi:hypothetical protein
MERVCADCSAILRGRADKKFCDDHCRSNYNNRLKNENFGQLKAINKILKKNRDILKVKNPEGKIKVKKDSLIANGFNFNYYTHTYTTQTGNIYFFCYEYGYLPLDNEEILLIKKEDKI